MIQNNVWVLSFKHPNTTIKKYTGNTEWLSLKNIFVQLMHNIVYLTIKKGRKILDPIFILHFTEVSFLVYLYSILSIKKNVIFISPISNNLKYSFEYN